MKCPLMSDKDYSIQLERKLNPGDCLKEECAWWVGSYGACAIQVLGGSLSTVTDTVARIEKKMPHVE